MTASPRTLSGTGIAIRWTEVPAVPPSDDILQQLYDREINCALSGLWDGGADWRLGDPVNG
jgi:hypothetical protein